MRLLATPVAAAGQRAVELMASGEARKGDEHFVRERFGRLPAEIGLTTVLDAIAEFEPDLLLSDPYEGAGLLAAAATDVPVALACWSRWAPLRTSGFVEHLLDGIEQAATAHSVRRAELEELFDRSPRTTPIPATLDTGELGANQVVRWRLSDPADDEVLDPEVGQRLQSYGRPLIYATLGSVAGQIPPMRERFVRALFPAVADLDVQCLFTVGRETSVADLQPAPDNVHIEQFVPHRPLLRIAEVAVTHGGVNSVIDAAAAAVPQVVVPLHARDGFWNGRALSESAVGRMLAEDHASPRRLREYLIDLPCNDDVRAAVDQLAAEIAALPSPDKVIDQLLDR